MNQVLPVLLALLPSALPVATQEAALQKEQTTPGFDIHPAERPGDGRQVCGLGKEFHAGRRAKLMELFPETVLVFRGLPGPRENLAFRQDKTFWWLTGAETPNAALILDAKSGRQILFLPKRTGRLEQMEAWEGEKWDSTDEWVPELTGFEEIRSTEELLDVLKEVLGDRKEVGTSMHPTIVMAGSYDTARRYNREMKADEFDGRLTRQEAFAKALEEKLGVEIDDITREIIDIRHVKTPEEIAAIKRASRSGALAMVEAMRSTAPGRGEWEIEGVMNLVQMREGAEGPGYAAIVGSGANSCILHYTAASRRMQDGDVLLIDFGPEVDHYVTDITRTWPVNGKFTERQAELYDAVLAAQEACIAAAKPGATLAQMSKICNEVFAERGLSEFVMHGPCHWVGMEVHDPGARPNDPVVPGTVFTIEPGLYEEETGIGIRIEDVVVITEDGCEVISADCPKDRASIEALVQEAGLLDRLAGQ